VEFVMRRSLVALAVTIIALPLAAQDTESRAERFVRDCEDFGRRDSERFCEVRDVRMPAGQRVFVDALENGSVRFFGADRSDVLVRALIQSYADSRGEAEALSKEVRIQTTGDRVFADGPSNRRYQGWYVSYEVWVPRRMNLEAETHNGSVSVSDVQGRMDLRAVNGSIAIRRAGGDIRAETTNGSVAATLTGSTWSGSYLDLETTNGSVVLDVPRGYNAQLETGTVNGGMNIDFPITVQGSISRRITTKLGSGGPRIRAMTTNGGVRIREVLPQ
jgi:hypothetical protein